MNTSLISLLIVLGSHTAIEETLEVLADPELMKALRQSIQEVAEEKLIPWEDAKADLGL
jgi:hypothetical protein